MCGWAILGGMKPIPKFLLASNYINLFGFALFSPLYALFALKVGAGALQTGAAYAVYTGLAGLIIILFGKFEDRFRDKRWLVVLGYFWLSGAALLFLLVKSSLSLFVVQAINAIGTGILFPAWKATYARFSNRGKEASEWSLFVGGNMLCTAVAALLGGLLVKLYNFRIIFVLMFLIQLCAALLSLYLVRSARKNEY